MKEKNPKVIAGIAALAVMLALGAVLMIQLIPTIGAVRLEMSLTPTPLPEMPDTVRARAVSEAVTAKPPLHNGSRGEEVRSLQSRLKDLGYYMGEVDGQFGEGTREAVVAFQRNNGLEADGLAGEETQKALYAKDAKRKEEQ